MNVVDLSDHEDEASASVPTRREDASRAKTPPYTLTAQLDKFVHSLVSSTASGEGAGPMLLS